MGKTEDVIHFHGSQGGLRGGPDTRPVVVESGSQRVEHMEVQSSKLARKSRP